MNHDDGIRYIYVSLSNSPIATTDVDEKSPGVGGGNGVMRS